MTTDEPKVCEHCGSTVGKHSWTEGDCLLPHRGHARRLIPNTFVCVWCVTRHHEWLREILDLYATLNEVIEPGSVPEDVAGDHKRPKKPADQPAPVRLAAWAMLFDADRLRATGQPTDLPNIPAVLTSWAQNAMDDRGLAGASLNGSAMTAVRILTEHAEFIASRPWIDTYDAELSWLRRALRAAHGIHEDREPVGRCRSLTGDGVECGGPLWPDRSGAMAVECGTCHRRFDEKFLRLLGGMLAG